MEVPRPLKHLVQKVLRGFYPCEHVIVVDLLIRKIVLKEDDMIELLRFEKKQLRGVLALLKNDKLIKFKLRMETGLDGKAFRQNYYYINYKDFVNVVKYKLDHIRKKFELIDRDNTSRASFICSYCRKSFTDLEVDMLLDSSGELRCTHCGSEVCEDPNHLPKADSRKMLAKFNETMEPLYMLLKEIEDIRLTAELLDPDIDSRIEQQAQQNYDGTFSTGKWSDKKKGLFGNAMANLNHFNVKIDDTDSTNNQNQNQPKKEQPIWMMESTISGATNNMAIENGAGGKMNKMINGGPNVGTNANIRPLIDTFELPSSISELSSSEQAKEILEILLSYEKPNDPCWFRICKYFGFTINTDNDDDNDENIVDLNEMTNNDENINNNNIDNQMDIDFFDCLPFISVNGCPISLIDLTDEHILKMNDLEKQEYIRIAQQLYVTVFDI
ncbi:transcription factor IIEalpha [Dermatophagoides pteronyssinus]|uniref:General transcription factor IIE subunit 1-like n=1 Tax=Dermatophagoides pteronyssinus TaxID=6956 RepID=A0A6P6Y6I9_DERPT|nr:general transcription factor IIE subunit 1-like [Dermatophagoides pteronyssinus]